jgi:tetratricopeptide (TPR) repeat protein
LRKADCLDLLGDFTSSIKSYSKAIEIDTKNKLAIYNRALTYEKVGELDKVLTDYQLAINVDPNNESELDNKLIYHNMGIVYGQMNQLDNAIKSFTSAIEIDKKYADAYHNRGFAYQLKGEHKIAIENFDLAIQLNPNEAEYENSKSRSKQQLNN